MPTASSGIANGIAGGPGRRLAKPVTVTLDRERVLVYDLNAICSFEEATGLSVVVALRDLTMINIRALIWAGLLVDDPDLTLFQAGALIRFGDIASITQALRDALRTDLAPGDDAGRPTNETAPEGTNGVSTGAVSGLSADTTSDSPIPISGV
jgi:hypothetical protein